MDSGLFDDRHFRCVDANLVIGVYTPNSEIRIAAVNTIYMLDIHTYFYFILIVVVLVTTFTVRISATTDVIILYWINDKLQTYLALP